MLENIDKLPLDELRAQWAKAWGREPHARIGRTMLIQSLNYKRREQETGGLSPDVRQRLKTLVAAYKRNPRCFDDNVQRLKPGTRLIRTHQGKKHSVLVTAAGFEYEGRAYSSLTKIANDITGKHWNGWVFFGLKKGEGKP